MRIFVIFYIAHIAHKNICFYVLDCIFKNKTRHQLSKMKFYFARQQNEKCIFKHLSFDFFLICNVTPKHHHFQTSHRDTLPFKIYT